MTAITHATSVDPASDPNAGKFRDPDRTLKGEVRARVPLTSLDTLWINTGSLCNITCANCYIESSPSNDRLAYVTPAEIEPLLDEARALGTREIGFTGGEPFLNPDIIALLQAALARGFDEKERGAATFARTLEGIDWLAANGFTFTIAGRTCWGESEADARTGYGALFAARRWPLSAASRTELILFPEMDGKLTVPEITVACWNILKISPSDMMCAHSRMVVKRKGGDAPVVLPCTLLPYDSAFEMGVTLAEEAVADGGMFENGAVKLCHPHCAKFCVLGGGSCS